MLIWACSWSHNSYSRTPSFNANSVISKPHYFEVLSCPVELRNIEVWLLSKETRFVKTILPISGWESKQCRKYCTRGDEARRHVKEGQRIGPCQWSAGEWEKPHVVLNISTREGINNEWITAVALAFEEMRTPYASGREICVRVETASCFLRSLYASLPWFCVQLYFYAYYTQKFASMRPLNPHPRCEHAKPVLLQLYNYDNSASDIKSIGEPISPFSWCSGRLVLLHCTVCSEVLHFLFVVWCLLSLVFTGQQVIPQY